MVLTYEAMFMSISPEIVVQVVVFDVNNGKSCNLIAQHYNMIYKTESFIYSRYVKTSSFHHRIQSGQPRTTGARDDPNMVHTTSINPFPRSETIVPSSILLETTLLIPILFVGDFVNLVRRVGDKHKHRCYCTSDGKCRSFVMFSSFGFGH